MPTATTKKTTTTDDKRVLLPRQDGAPEKEYKTVDSIKQKALREEIASVAESLAETVDMENRYKAAGDELRDRLWGLMKQAKIPFLAHKFHKFHEQEGEYAGINGKLLREVLLIKKLKPTEINEIIEAATTRKSWTTLRVVDTTKKRGGR